MASIGKVKPGGSVVEGGQVVADPVASTFVAIASTVRCAKCSGVYALSRKGARIPITTEELVSAIG